MAVLTGSDISADHTVAAYARDAVIGIADLAARSLGGGHPPAAAAREGGVSPAEMLFDLRLTASLRSWLKPAADVLGLALEDGKVREKYGRRDRQVTFLTDGVDIRRTLLYIDKKVLNDTNAIDALGMVMWAIEKNEFVAVFGEDVILPVPVNANIIDGLWRERIDSRFIAWSFVSELPLLDLLDQVEFMRTRLNLEALNPRSQRAGAGEVTIKEMDRIVAILCARGDFNDTRGRGTLLTQAGLDTFSAIVKLEGASKQVGIDLVWQLTQHQNRVPPDNYTALGALLRTVMEFSDTPPADKNWLNALITRCAL